MSEVEDYIYQFDGNQREVMLYFHIIQEAILLDEIKPYESKRKSK